MAEFRVKRIRHTVFYNFVEITRLVPPPQGSRLSIEGVVGKVLHLSHVRVMRRLVEIRRANRKRQGKETRASSFTAKVRRPLPTTRFLLFTVETLKFNPSNTSRSQTHLL